MGLIEQIRAKDFKYWNLKDADTLDSRFDEVQKGDWTICFNDQKLNVFSGRYIDEKMVSLTRGVIYQILDKKINRERLNASSKSKCLEKCSAIRDNGIAFCVPEELFFKSISYSLFEP